MGTVTRSNNLFWPASTAPSPLGSGDITANPKLGSSLELLAGSPAINAGINVGLPYNGSAPDMGAFESGTTPPSGGTVTGQVTCAGAPLVGASVGVGAYATAVTDANGNYTLSATSGSQNVTASKSAAGTPGYTTATQAATVPANGTVTVNFALTANTGTTYYINPGYEYADDSLQDGLAPGDDPVHGPWATLSGGAGILQPGDVVKVVGSTTPYTVTSQGVISDNGAASFPITYEAVDSVHYNYSPGAVTFVFTNQGSSAGVNFGNRSYIVMDGINFAQTGASGSNSSLIAGGYSNNITVKNCTFTSDSWNWHAVDLPGAGYCTFENNVVGPFPWGNSSGICLSWGSTYDRIINNTVVGCSSTGISTDASNGALTGCMIQNNIVVGSGWVGFNNPGGVFHSNNLYDNTPNTDIFQTVAGPGDIVGQNPLLDSTNHLLSGSPAIDAGCLVGLPFNGQMPDIGAFESAFVGPVPNATPLGTVTGQVTNLATSAPLAGALVSAGTLGSAVANANGNYSLQLKTGSTTIKASATGYGSIKQTVNVVAGTQSVNFGLTAAVPGQFYISTNGDDSNDGVTSNSAWATLDNATTVNGVVANTTVNVLPGTYNYNHQVSLQVWNGNTTGPVTYKAQGNVVLNFTAYGDSGQCGINLNNSNNVVIDGFTTVQAAPTSGDPNNMVIQLWDSKNVVIKNCHLTSNAWNWRYLTINASGTDTTDNFVFENNVVGPFPWSGNGCSCIYLGPGVENSHILNNTFNGLDPHGWTSGIDMSTAGLTGSEVRNNIFENMSPALQLNTDLATAHTNNLYYLCGTAVSGVPAGSTEIIGENPLLDANDHLTYGSPAIDAGVNVGLPYVGSAPDIGAFEFQGAGTVTGTVTSGGAAIAGATVTTVNQTTTTGAAGTYTLSNTEAGPYNVTASAGDYYTATQSTVIPVGGSVTVNFTLTSKPPVTYYVVDGGSDSNDGLTTDTGWASVNNGDVKGILNPGDTVVIDNYVLTPAGTDGTSVCPIANCSGTATRPITYTGINYGQIDTCQGGDGPVITANYIVFNGLNITMEDSNADTVPYDTANPFELLNTTGSVVSNCSFSSSDWTWKGVWINGATNCKLYDNLISFTGTKPSGPYDSTGINDGGYVGGKDYATGSGNWVVNNTIAGCSGLAYQSPLDETGRVLKNNIFVNCGWGIQAGNTGIAHSNNMFYGVPSNAGGTLVTAGTDSTYVLAPTETTTVNPMLNADYTLQSTSPAIDAGAYVGLPFQGKAPDIGAFEYPGTLYTLETVTGLVKSTSGAGISGALVTAGAYANWSTTTNSSGYYTLTNVAGAAMVMSAAATSYATGTQTPNLASTQVVNFTLSPGSQATQVARLSALKTMADNNVVQITAAKVVTVSSGVFANSAVYIEESDRTCGIKVLLASGQSVTAGNNIKLTGTLKTDANGERYIQCTSIDSNDNATTAPLAVGVANNGITNMVGLLVKVWGATTTATGVVNVNDGSVFDSDGNNDGVNVTTTGITKTIGSFLSVTGIVSKTTGGALIVQPRGNADLN